MNATDGIRIHRKNQFYMKKKINLQFRNKFVTKLVML